MGRAVNAFRSVRPGRLLELVVGSDPVRRHNASVLVYVLEGSVVMQARGGKEVTLTKGETFFESPETFMSSGDTGARRSPPSFSPSPSRTRAHPWSFRLNRQGSRPRRLGCWRDSQNRTNDKYIAEKQKLD